MCSTMNWLSWMDYWPFWDCGWLVSRRFLRRSFKNARKDAKALRSVYYRQRFAFWSVRILLCCLAIMCSITNWLSWMDCWRFWDCGWLVSRRFRKRSFKNARKDAKALSIRTIQNSKLTIQNNNNCPSPDGSEHPFVPGFGAKDKTDSRIKLLMKNTSISAIT